MLYPFMLEEVRTEQGTWKPSGGQMLPVIVTQAMQHVVDRLRPALHRSSCEDYNDTLVDRWTMEASLRRSEGKVYVTGSVSCPDGSTLFTFVMSFTQACLPDESYPGMRLNPTTGEGHIGPVSEIQAMATAFLRNDTAVVMFGEKADRHLAESIAQIRREAGKGPIKRN